MIQSRIAGNINVEKYIDITEFNHFDNIFFAATAVGIIEGNIQIQREDNRITLFDIYSVDCGDSDYTFLLLYNLVRSNRRLYNLIVDYFNVWHGGETEIFTYDCYHKNELNSNFNYLVSLICNELGHAIKNKKYEIVSAYESFLYDMAEEFK